MTRLLESTAQCLAPSLYVRLRTGVEAPSGIGDFRPQLARLTIFRLAEVSYCTPCTPSYRGYTSESALKD